MKILRLLMQTEAIVAALAYAATTLLLLADVFSREFLSRSLWGAQQSAILLSILAGMIGLTLATGRQAHFRPEFADGILAFSWVDRLGDLISAILFAGFAYFAVEFVVESRNFSDRVPVINLTLWPVQIVVPYAMASSAIKHFVFALNPAAKEQLGRT
ncbi:TRAP transporter small permease [Hoeflea poritis]|uniref:TRAP transporter small permease protein n=1 Tax=Hoeflea poritis TaxID=2993659 RepID=A0ABT4VKB7_9HYPH|nr:TRAP transporter small permease subunit [Hoeflea poritis]MDA4845150.1 TRAP transporter small permease subunit [Hoeflea poritis]